MFPWDEWRWLAGYSPSSAHPPQPVKAETKSTIRSQSAQTMTIWSKQVATKECKRLWNIFWTQTKHKTKQDKTAVANKEMNQAWRQHWPLITAIPHSTLKAQHREVEFIRSSVGVASLLYSEIIPMQQVRRQLLTCILCCWKTTSWDHF